MNPLPPIEQYNVYTNQYVSSAIPTIQKKQGAPGERNGTAAPNLKLQSAFDTQGGVANGGKIGTKNERDAMVAQLFAAKKSMQSEPYTAGTTSYANGFKK